MSRILAAFDMRKSFCAALVAVACFTGLTLGGDRDPGRVRPWEQSLPAPQKSPISTTPWNAQGWPPAVNRVTQIEAIEPTPPSPLNGLQVLPLEKNPGRDNIQLSGAQDRVSLSAVDAPLNVVLAMIAEQHGLNMVTGGDMTERITVKITEASLNDTLDVLLKANGYTWFRRREILVVSKLNADQRALGMPGRVVRLFPLNYMNSTDADSVIKGLLSPVGQSFTHQSLSTDLRRTHEQVIVEDLPEHVDRIAAYLAQADRAPRQVVIEAHVLQVTLKDDCRHGVNLEQIVRTAGGTVTLATTGFATGVNPLTSLKIKGADLNGVIECIKATTDSKTLASPKVAVLNNQEATMQVGSKIGYLMTTTTQTSTLQSVNFLDVGVILKVTPTISDDGQMLIQVKPQVSTGRINATTNLPESETTEVQTRVLLGDGEAIVIGGLIKETDIDSQSKIPILGDLWLVGWLFQKTQVTRERNEIIITLLPRIVPDATFCRESDQIAIERAHTPLLQGAVQRVDRTMYEPRFTTYADGPHMKKTQTQNQYCPPAPGYAPSAVPVYPGNYDQLPPPPPQPTPQLNAPTPAVETRSAPLFPPPPVSLPPFREPAVAPVGYQAIPEPIYRLPPP